MLGNHLHNANVIKEGEGTIIPVYRPHYDADYTKYLPCVDCYGYIVKTDLWKHNCPFGESNGEQKQKERRQFVKDSRLLLPIPGAWNHDTSPTSNYLSRGAYPHPTLQSCRGDFWRCAGLEDFQSAERLPSCAHIKCWQRHWLDTLYGPSFHSR